MGEKDESIPASLVIWYDIPESIIYDKGEMLDEIKHIPSKVWIIPKVDFVK